MLMNPFLNSMMHFNHSLLSAEATAAAAAAAVASLIQPNDSSVADMEKASQLLLNLNNQFENDRIIKSDAINTSSSISNILNDNKNDKNKLISNTKQSAPSSVTVESNNSKTAEVMCNLCTKLFYTEEFLAMHKLNKHGVPLANSESLVQIASCNRDSASTTSTQNNDKHTNVRNSVLKSIKNEPESQQQIILNNDKENNLEDAITKSRNNILVNALYAKDILSDAKTTSDLVEIDREKFNFLNVQSNSVIGSMNESYCEFCNKSFCNKYFLKTHMLRSHGKLLKNSCIKQDLEDNEYLISQSHSLDGLQNQHQLQNLQQHHHHHQHNHQSNNSNTTKQQNSESDSELNASSSTYVNGGAIDTNFAAKIADRVVCDICNKQVCNKYFLKTHKQKVHGLQMSDTNSKINDFCEDNNSCSSEEISLKMEYSMNNALTVEVNDHINDHQHNSVSNGNDSLLISKYKQISNSTTTNSISPHLPQQQPLLQTSSQQQISRDSYCELCKRQFCSKYFLRNHMINMHGINQNKFNYNKAQMTTTSTTTATMPVVVQSIKDKDMESVKKTKLIEQINSPLSSVSSSNNTNTNNNNNNNNTSSSTPLNGNSSVNLNTVASRVMCVICNKDLCNKYFLRQHLINVHKTSIEEYNEKFDTKSRNEGEEGLLINDYAANQQMSPDDYNGNENNTSIEDESKVRLEKFKNNHIKFLSLISEKNKNLKRRKRQYSESSSISSRSSNSVFSKYSLGTLSSSSSSSSSSNSSTVSGKLKHKFFNKKLHKNGLVISNRYKNDNEKKKMISLDATTIIDEDRTDIDMQQFLLESSDDIFCTNFLPCMIYLPVRYKISDSVNINLTLKPIKRNRKDTYHENDEIGSLNNRGCELGEIKSSNNHEIKKIKKKLKLNDNLK